MSRILIIGGYGGFGVRLCRRLAEDGHQVLVGGRSLTKAVRLCVDLPGAAPVAVDRTGDVSAALRAERPELVIDAAGPFQDSSYSVPEACIAARIPYLDLADARGFVCGIDRLDAAAREAGVPVVSGASSLPALTGAIVRSLADGLDRVDSVEVALSASNRASGGASVVEAILSYVGRPVRLWRGGRWTTGHGWQELRRVDFPLSGGGGLFGRLVGLCDVPDLEALPAPLPGRPAVTFRAGTELRFQMLSLWLATWPVRWGWLRSLRPLAPLLLRLYGATLGLGGARSAMSVVMKGKAGPRRLERRWTIVAEQGEGLHIPTLAAQLLAGDMLARNVPPGARSAAGLLTLDRFAPLLAGLACRHETAERTLPPPLYARAMGAAFERLPPAVRLMHDFCGDSGAAGEATVTRGRGPLARLLARVMGFPPAGRWPLHLHFSERDGVETWTRDYGGHVMRSALSERPGGVVERFGPVRFAFDLLPRPDGLDMPLRGWSLFRIPLLRILAPRIAAREWEEGGRFRFDVAAGMPLVGPVVRYSGWLNR